MPRLPRPHPLVDFLRIDSANRHVLACGDQTVGPMTPKFEKLTDSSGFRVRRELYDHHVPHDL